MSKKDRIYMPMGAGGLLRYQDEEKQVFKIKPRHVVILVVLIAFLEVAVRFIFPGIA
ncbi:MAG: preprotein translocase subunit Sec61beta [Candidatus Aenigmarchaeota archaeon]|nr:preprotein translocase subunit Sec61beta [Candidatus Aenigmarchaeota archaeon]